jgi:hypothetical protein
MGTERTADRRKWLFYAALTALLVTAALAAGIYMPNKSETKKIWGVGPLRTVMVTIPEAARESCFAQMTRFADDSGFRVRIARIDPNKPQFGVDMIRSDIRVAGDNILDPLVFRISFYANTRSDSDYDREVLLPVVDPLVERLKDAAASVPGVSIAQTR